MLWLSIVITCCTSEPWSCLYSSSSIWALVLVG